MKILGLKFKNINSLYGEWEIRFDQPPFSDTGLFAIVGPNGSGKSSILDALTLALYGETARLKNPGLEVMNRHAEDSFSEVMFSVDGTVYRSGWSIRRGNGEQASPNMWFERMNGEGGLLEERVIKVRERVAELTGLDFKRFCRSILLSQGEFSAFLNALENERAEILEKIIGPEMAQELEESVRSRATIESERFHQLKETAAAFPVPDRGQVEDARRSHSDLQDELEEVERSLLEFESMKDGLEKVDRLEAEEKEAAEALALAEAEAREARENLEKLGRAKTVDEPLKLEVTAFEELKAQGDAAQDEADRLREEMDSGKARILELQALLEQVRRELEQARAQLEDRGEEWDQVSLLDRDIEAESGKFLELVSRYEGVERSQRENLQHQGEIQQHFPEVERRLQEANRWLEEHVGDSGLEEHMTALSELQERLASMAEELKGHREKKAAAMEAEQLAAKELHRAQASAQKVRYASDRLLRRKAGRDRRVSEALQGETLESLANLLHAQKKKLAVCRRLVKLSGRFRELAQGGDPEDALAQARAQRDSLKESLDLERERLGQWADRILMRDSMLRLAPERSALQDDSPCPLCGALDHPYVEKGLPDFSELDAAVAEIRGRITVLEEELAGADAAVGKLEAQDQGVRGLRQEWAGACAEVAGEWSISETDVISREVQKTRDEIRSLKSRIRTCRWNGFWSDFIGRSLNKKTEVLASRDQLRESAMERHEAREEDLKAISREMQRLEDEEKAVLDDMEGRFRLCGETAPMKAGHMSLLARLRVRHEAYSYKLEEQKALEKELLELEAGKTSLPLELESLSEQAEQLSVETESVQMRLNALREEREKLYGTTDPVEKRRAVDEEIQRCSGQEIRLSQEMDSLSRMIQDHEDRLPLLISKAREIRSELKRVQSELEEKAVGAGFGSLDELRKLIGLLPEEQALVERHAGALRALEEREPAAVAARDALEAVRSVQQAGESLDSLGWKMGEAAKRRDELRRMVEDLEARLAQYRDAEREYRDLLQAMAVQEKIWSEVMGEQSALQSRDNAERRARVQRLMLDRLIEQSNEYLTALSGRYALGCHDDNGFRLAVQDFLQENALRPVKTLSGGESFLVSLCLALGLSDMAGRHRKIESLFLDEGFGSLDEEMLYRVMAVLKSLRANGKLVGVISHVKRLADEIPTQIRVEKMAGGFSRITVVA